MALLKKNQLNNVLFVMVDKTDFATIESGVAASDIDVKLYGVAHGNSTAASTITVSKTPALVRSGLFQLTLEAGETDSHDHFMLRLSNASCATQYIPLEMVDYDDSDMYSLLSDTQSKLVIVSGVVSDVYSLLSDHHSDMQSRTSDLGSKITAADSQLTVNYNLISDVHSLVSDVDSQLTVTTATVSNIDSVCSDVLSKVTGVDSQLTVTHSLVSDIDSALTSQFTYTSNMLSQISMLLSDVESQIDAGVTVSASSMSDIASRVWVTSAASDLKSGVDAAASRALINQSRISDVYSLASDIDSQLTVTHSMVSDIDSALTSQFSDLKSRISGITASVSASDISDIASAVWAHSDASDLKSSADAAASRALVIQSMVSDVDSQLTVTHSLLSDVDSALTLVAADLPGRATKNAQLANLMFLMVDSTDHVTGKTGLTITATVSKDGGAFSATTNSATEVSGGWYKITLTQPEMNADVVALQFTATGADAAGITILTQPT